MLTAMIKIIISNFIQNNVFNNNIIKYYKYVPGTEIMKLRSNGIIQLSTNSENNNNDVTDFAILQL